MRACGWLAAGAASAARREAVIVVSPHPDGESILAADTIHSVEEPFYEEVFAP